MLIGLNEFGAILKGGVGWFAARSLGTLLGPICLVLRFSMLFKFGQRSDIDLGRQASSESTETPFGLFYIHIGCDWGRVELDQMEFFSMKLFRATFCENS